VAALVWKDAIIAWLAPLLESGSGAVALTWAAIIVTAVAVILTIVFAKLLGEPQ
jgi:hypothetical protein